MRPFSPWTIFMFRTAKHLSNVTLTKALRRWSCRSVIRISLISIVVFERPHEPDLMPQVFEPADNFLPLTTGRHHSNDR